ncbi:MAG: DUF2807 domain-containing protein [Prevotellaceae bacterium]|nr:DUF2807 domain-containing protein [Prevotellaceae bacterium]
MGNICDIRKLLASGCELRASDGSDLDIYMKLSGNLKAKASGGSSMNLRGKAKQVAVSTRGHSNVEIRKLAYRDLTVQHFGWGENSMALPTFKFYHK